MFIAHASCSSHTFHTRKHPSFLYPPLPFLSLSLSLSNYLSLPSSLLTFYLFLSLIISLSFFSLSLLSLSLFHVFLSYVLSISFFHAFLSLSFMLFFLSYNLSISYVLSLLLCPSLYLFIFLILTFFSLFVMSLFCFLCLLHDEIIDDVSACFILTHFHGTNNTQKY